MKTLFKFFILCLIIWIILGLFIIINISFPKDIVNQIVDNFNKTALGVSALLAAFAGNRFLSEESERKKTIRFYKDKYPQEDYGQTWKMIVRQDREGEPHILEINKGIKHHIWNMKTIYDLGWQFYTREPVTIEQFDGYTTGDPIRTRGELGE